MKRIDKAIIAFLAMGTVHTALLPQGLALTVLAGAGFVCLYTAALLFILKLVKEDKNDRET